MTGNTVVLLKDISAVSLEVIHRRQVGRFCSFGIDVAAVENEYDAKRAEYSSIIDKKFPANPVNTGIAVYVKSIKTGFQFSGTSGKIP